MTDPHIPISQAVTSLESGFCLWIGAGVTKQILADKKLAPLWSDLTRELEEYAGLIPGSEKDGRYPERLGLVFEHLQYDEPENFGEPTLFRKYIRTRLLTEVCVDLLRTAHATPLQGDLIPARIRQVACFGQLANPIVSFNVEDLSSVLLARPGGPVRILPYSKGKAGEVGWHEPSGTFQRIVYHPHGLITSHPVMTKSDYTEKDSTLAFALAIHLAFRNNLVIVGMSLDDEYLRAQIREGRDQIDDIFWFNSAFREDQLDWAEKARVQVVEIPWDDFWAYGTRLRVEINEWQLHVAWWLALTLALDEAQGGHIDKWAQLMKQTDPDRVRRFSQLSSEYGERGQGNGLDFDAPGAVQEIARETEARFKMGLPLLHHHIR